MSKPMTDDPVQALIAQMRAYTATPKGYLAGQVALQIDEWADTLAALGGSGWQPIATAPKDGTPVRLFAPSLFDPDFNVSSSVEGYWQDDDGWIGAVWCSEHDHWQAKPIQPTGWRSLPASPVETERCDCSDTGKRDCPRCKWLWEDLA